MFLLFEGFHPQNVLNLFLHLLKYSYLLTNIEYFNTTLEEYKVMHPDGTSEYIIKDDFDGVKVILFQANF